MWPGVQAELCTCYVGVFFELTQRVGVQLMQIHIGLSRELILAKQIRFCFQLKLEVCLIKVYLTNFKHLQIVWSCMSFCFTKQIS